MGGTCVEVARLVHTTHQAPHTNSHTHTHTDQTPNTHTRFQEELLRFAEFGFRRNV